MASSQRYQIIVINLAPDAARRKAISDALSSLSLDYQILAAINGKRLSSEQILNVQSRWRWLIKGYTFTAGQVGCWLSHRLAWTTFLNGPADICLVLEDDAVLAPNFQACVEEVLDLALKHDLVQLEYRTKPNRAYQVIHNLECGVRVLAVSGKTNGGAGYLVRRKGAERLLSVDRMAFCNDDWSWYQALTGLTRAAIDPCVVRLSDAPSSIDKVNGLSGKTTRRQKRNLLWPIIHRHTLQPILYHLLRATISLRTRF